MKEIDIEEIRDMGVKEIQKKITEMQKIKTASSMDSTVMETSVDAVDRAVAKKNIARCKTVLNERMSDKVRS